ncbi:MAG: hypothetical protein U5K72_01420 [Balneolaceae bacterium]|nr:hypothetical protein [Balneolaceae bacterium]
MKKNLLFLLLLSCFLGLETTKAQQNSDLKYRTFRVTLLPGLSTNGVEAPNYSWYSFFDGNRGTHNFDFWVEMSAGIQLF